MIDCNIISSNDHSFAISDTLKKCLRETKEFLLISAPYVSKNFIDMIRNFVSRGITVKLLIRIPDERNKDLTFSTVESFMGIANSMELRLSVMCNPFLHAKFIVSDNRIVLSGSVNPTGSGIYYNDEILYIFTHPTLVKRHIEIFNELWNGPRNTRWENVQLYFGHNRYGDRYLTHKIIAERIIGFFHMNGNQETRKSVLVEKIARKGFNKENIIEVIRNLLESGILYQPKPDVLKLTNYQTNIHDF